MDHPTKTVLVDKIGDRWVLHRTPVADGNSSFVYKLVTRTESAVRDLLDLDDEDG